MNKTAIKNFAVWARRELIEKVSQKALQYGISENNIEDADADSINGKLLTPSEKTQRKALINKIKNDGYQQTIEEIAYTWFNRFIALRFMEVNDYLPEHIRVFTNENNEFKPQILTEAITIDLVGLDKKKVYAFKESNDDEGLYRYLIITQCNALNEILPKMFQKLEDYTELLFPDFILREDSVIKGMIEQIPEEDFEDAVQIIGWLYQYYNTDNFEKIYDGDMSKTRVNKTDLPAATQLFTPDWVVRYMVENSLGRLWTEGHPEQSPKSEWKYYIEEAEQTDDVKEKLAEIKKEYTKITPEQIKCIDPCMGSGHILCYMFDVLIQIYRQYGYNDRDAVESIILHNIYGLDIDSRAGQLAYFAIMMKAVQYDKRFLSRGIIPNVYEIKDSHEIDETIIQSFANNDLELTRDIKVLVKNFCNAKEYGSLTEIDYLDYKKLFNRLNELKTESDLLSQQAKELITPLILQAQALSQKYDVIVTNPPYMGNNRMSLALDSFVKQFYENSKTDLSSVMMEKIINSFLKNNGFYAAVTTVSWMTLKSFEKYRIDLLDKTDFCSLVDFGTELFDGKVGHLPIVAWAGRKTEINSNYTAIRLVDFCYSRRNEKEEQFFNKDNYSISNQKDYKKIPNNIIAYWTSPKIIEIFSNTLLGEIAQPRQGMATSDNNRFVREWFEVSNRNIKFNAIDSEDALKSNKKWFPYNKGGEYRKWYGNNDYIVNYEHDGKEIKDYAFKLYKSVTRTIKNIQYYFKPCFTWSLIGFDVAFRYKPAGGIFDVGGMSCFCNNNLEYLLGLCNSKVSSRILRVLAPTINFQAGDIANIPVIITQDENKLKKINTIVKENISISKEDWDTSESSWDFNNYPLIQQTSTIKSAYENWQKECNERFNKLKTNEEELNHIFIEIYGLQDELTPDVDEKDVTVRKADLKRDIKSFISYAVGCMFGRYSLDKEGLIFAGGVFDPSNYKTFEADKDAIIPICDDDSFNDDIVNRFVEFVSKVYGKENLEENLRFIADALGGNGTSRDVIRNYFINGFYKDHIQTYQKRPIYWLFDSGKNNGLKCLIYMHRYSKDTIARIRTDYVHDRQGVYENRIEELNQKIKSASGAEKIKLSNQLKDTKAKAEELHKYEEKIHHLADQMIEIDLDDGVKHNYEIFKDVLAPLK